MAQSRYGDFQHGHFGGRDSRHRLFGRLLVFAFAQKQEIGRLNSSAKIKAVILLMGAIEVGAVSLVNYGLTIGDAILITPIASALSIVTIMLAIVFLRDRGSKPQGLGIVMAIVGIVTTAV